MRLLAPFARILRRFVGQGPMIDVAAALDHLGRLDPTTGPFPEGLPPQELMRSPAAARVGHLAARDGLLLAHFEHRAPVPSPDEAPAWHDGVLPEDKYASFRHELPIGSFHPGHRAKWGAHELCHALVGFAWWPGATPLSIATAGRLAELVPVVLWYFLDEIGLRRCPRHCGPLFRTFCPDCETAAFEGPAPLQEARAADHLRDAARFLDSELAAVARTRRLGRPVSHVWGSLDLARDGVAYAAGHGARLGDPRFARWAERFFKPEHGGHSDLDALEARVVEVARGIAEGREVRPWVGDARVGRARWAAMDLGARLLDASADRAGNAVTDLVDRLADGERPASVVDDVRARAVSLDLSHADDVFAVGYPLEGVSSRAVARVADGLDTVVPVTLELFDDAGLDPVPAFVAADRPQRLPLGERFADWLADTQPGPVADLARYEALLRAAGGAAEDHALASVGDGLRLVGGARVARFGLDPVALAEQAANGEIEGRAEGGRLVFDVPVAVRTALVFARDAAGALVLVDLPDGYADQLELDPAALPADIRSSMLELGVLVPARWSVG